jgi:hypothetical protein
MNELTLTFIYLTLPSSDQPILNIQAAGSDELHRYALTREQLFALNAQTADALLKGASK